MRADSAPRSKPETVTVPLVIGAKVLQGAAAARRDAPHLVPKTVTGCGLLGAQCTRPSLMGNPWGFFTIGAGVELQPLTYDGGVSQPLTNNGQVLQRLYLVGKVLQGATDRFGVS